MDKGVTLKFDYDYGGWNEVNTQTNPDLIELVPRYGYYGERHYDIKAKENCWAYVTETIILSAGRGNSGSDTDSVAGSSTSYSYWQPLTKGTIYSRSGVYRVYTVYPIKK